MQNRPPEGIRPAGPINNSRKTQRQEVQPEPPKVAEKTGETGREIDLKNDPTQFLGRSQVKKRKITINPDNFDNDAVNNISNDLETLKANRKLVFGSDKVFNNIYKKTGNYAEAADMQTRFVEEFSPEKKKPAKD